MFLEGGVSTWSNAPGETMAAQENDTTGSWSCGDYGQEAIKPLDGNPISGSEAGVTSTNSRLFGQVKMNSSRTYFSD